MQHRIVNIKNLLFYLIPFALGCYIYATPAIIIAFIAFWILEGNLKSKLTQFLNNKVALLFVSFYLLHLLGMFYTHNPSAGWFDLQVKLSILLFPVALVSEGAMDFRKQKHFTAMFATGLTLNGLICLGHAVWLYLAKDKYIFQYKEFSLFLHPTYYSMYIDIAFALGFSVITRQEAMLSKLEKRYFGMLFCFLIFMLILLQSKTGLITSGIVIFLILIRYISFTKLWTVSIASVIIISLIAALTEHFIINTGPSRFQSVGNIMLNDKPVDTKSVESSQARILIWRSALPVIKEFLLYGVGTGGVEDALVKQYSKNQYTGIMKSRLNAHNEYMQVTIELGLIGLLCLLSCLFIPLYLSIRQRRFVYFIFLTVLIINFLTESVLETQGGTMFYGFFNSLLMFNFVI